MPLRGPGTTGGGITGLTANTIPYANTSTSLADSAVSKTELEYLDGVTSAVQTQIDSKVTSPTWATFSPTVTLVGGVGNQVPVYTTNVGRYLQIGKIIFVDIYLAGDGGNEGAGTGVFTIALPAAAGANQQADQFPIGRGVNTVVETDLTGSIAAGASVITIGYYGASTYVTAQLTGADQNNATRSIRAHFFYESA